MSAAAPGLPVPIDVTRAVERARAAYVRACYLDIAVRKPGNVSLASSGHGMEARQFVDSARVSADPLFAQGASVGERIEAAVEATWSAVGCNTNLGILLLCAPVALAVERQPDAFGPAALCAAIERVLEGLTQADAAAAFRAIARANPGGLGQADREDVHAVPTVGLRAAMAIAAERDAIARCYRDGYATLFEVGVAALAGWCESSESLAIPGLGGSVGQPVPAAAARAVLRCYLALLGDTPDSHIVRKRGAAAAHSVMQDARRWRDDPRLADPQADLEFDAAFVEWDRSLKLQGLNPGTTADLTVTALVLTSLTPRETSPSVAAIEPRVAG